ncbi:S8 family peptidase [Segetibacter koreensis]|uniref:S8 family peptidase n=1 Tax=Segetibacter koreensis TaxID=398037 RepID=UPI00039D8000|nr:S8 family peptidase [Segetibacter koreensis]
MKKNPLYLIILLMSTFAACKKDLNFRDEQGSLSTEAAGRPGQLSPDAVVPNELLVKFKKGTAANVRAAVLARVSGNVSEKVLTKAMQQAGDDEGFLVVKTPLQALEAVGKVKGLDDVQFAEPNYIYTHDIVSGDPYFTNGSLWGMYGDASSPTNQYGSRAAEAWGAGHTGSASVVVGVIDEGIQFTHPDLSGQVWTNPYDPVNGVDDDHNGYIDDIHGWDFDGNNNTIYDGGTNGGLDDHGTHVSGTIGAKNNGSGVVGVNWKVTLISCKFLGRRGGTTANAVKAVDYLSDLKTRHEMNIVASNNSWGGGGFSQALYDAVNRANSKNILFIAAAGNGGSDGVGDNNDVTPSYPSNMDLPNVIAVAAITSTGDKASFSNFGATTVDIGAPGQGIYSTTAYNSYESYSGTSMATPHVTGAAALYAASHPGSAAATIKNAILSSAVPTPSLARKCVTGGRLNVSGF